jgi:hypothetical protein
MPRRLLTIASIVCLVLCVALMCMWVRSFWRADSVLVSSPWQTCRLASALGVVDCEDMHGIPLAIGPRWKSWSFTSDDRRKFFLRSFLGFHVGISAADSGFSVPYWCLVLLSGSVAAIPWIGKSNLQFTLRHLFIPTTFLAVVLGMIAWLDRAWTGK